MAKMFHALWNPTLFATRGDLLIALWCERTTPFASAGQTEVERNAHCAIDLRKPDWLGY